MYKKITLLFILVLVVLVSFGFVNTWAWNDKRTHKDLSEKAAEHSVLSLTSGNYLKSLGFSKNIEEPFILNGKSKSVKEWIGEGGIKEDAGNIFTAYYYNHFHNPLRIWSQAGLTTIYPSINGMSSLIWAQDTSTPNPWRWQKAREYYYIALTGKDFSGLEVASSKEKRDEYFAQTFKGLGHIIHLIEDAAQPAHVRDDPHPLDDIGIVPQFENWAYYNAEALGLYDLTPVFPTVSLNTSAEPGYIPITQFWDTNQFSDTNPVGGNAVGLAEYTGANFFSEDTIFPDSFPYPSLSSVVEYEETIDTNTGEQRTYLKKTGDGETIQHLATARWFYRYLPTEYKRLGLKLDDNVYQDYASLLLPRAVGYSASLLNYFFRGQLAVVPVDSNNVKIQNLSKDTLNSGIIELYYDNTQDERIWLTTYNITTPIAQGQTTDTIYFIPPTDNKTPGRYWAVFRGKLGEEEDAVIGSFGYSWTEEWDRGLFGNHPWYTTMNDPTARIPYGSTILAEVSNGILTQENMRPAGTTSSSQNAQLNSTRIGIDPYGSTAYLDAFPLPVTSNTGVSIKVDLLNTNFSTPLPQCIYTNVNGAYQHILIVFNQTFNDGTTYIAFTVSGQQYNTTDTFRPVFITPGVEARINIYQELQRRGVTFTEPLQISRINITQQFLPPCDTTTEDQQQLMQVDYIRIIDGTAMP